MVRLQRRITEVLFVTRKKIRMMKVQLELKSVKKKIRKDCLRHVNGKGGLNKRLIHYLMSLVFSSQTGVSEDKTEVLHTIFASILHHQQWVLKPQELWV